MGLGKSLQKGSKKRLSRMRGKHEKIQHLKKSNYFGAGKASQTKIPHSRLSKGSVSSTMVLMETTNESGHLVRNKQLQRGLGLRWTTEADLSQTGCVRLLLNGACPLFIDSYPQMLIEYLLCARHCSQR